MTLYELTAEYQQLLDLAEDPDIPEEALADSLEALGMDIEDKADGYAKVIAQLNADASALKAEIDRLTARKRTIERNVDRMKDSLKTAMILTGKTKFKTDLFSFGIQKNPPKVVIDDPSRIYPEYLIEQDPKVDTMAIRNALKDDAEAPLWEGIAHLEQTEGVRIR